MELLEICQHVGGAEFACLTANLNRLEDAIKTVRYGHYKGVFANPTEYAKHHFCDYYSLTYKEITNYIDFEAWGRDLVSDAHQVPFGDKFLIWEDY